MAFIKNHIIESTGQELNYWRIDNIVFINQRSIDISFSGYVSEDMYNQGKSPVCSRSRSYNWLNDLGTTDVLGKAYTLLGTDVMFSEATEVPD